MKRLSVITLFAAFIISSSGCSTLKKLGLIPSELEMAMGLKDALSQGLFKGFNAFADPNGNPLVRFAFPAKPRKSKKHCGILVLIKLLTR